MTTTSREPILCTCGHTGYLKLRENDQPYSGLREVYSLEGFAGGSVTITNANDAPEDVLKTLSPKCPMCGQAGAVRRATISR